MDAAIHSRPDVIPLPSATPTTAPITPTEKATTEKAPEEDIWDDALKPATREEKPEERENLVTVSRSPTPTRYLIIDEDEPSPAKTTGKHKSPIRLSSDYEASTSSPSTSSEFEVIKRDILDYEEIMRKRPSDMEMPENPSADMLFAQATEKKWKNFVEFQFRKLNEAAISLDERHQRLYDEKVAELKKEKTTESGGKFFSDFVILQNF